MLQLTGRANYADYGKALGVDLVNNPTLAAQPALSLKIACEYWKRRNINADCDRDDAQAVTRQVNRRLNLSDRRLHAKGQDGGRQTRRQLADVGRCGSVGGRRVARQRLERLP